MTGQLGKLTRVNRLFETDYGTRYGTFVRNGRALLEYEPMVVTCLVGRRPTCKVTLKHAELAGYMQGTSWSKLRIEVGIPLLIWENMMNQFHREVSKPGIKFGEAKSQMRKLVQR